MYFSFSSVCSILIGSLNYLRGMEATKHVILNWKNPNSDRKSWTLLVTYYESDTVTLTLYLMVFSMFDRFFELFDKYGGYKTGHLKLKKPKQLQEILDIARDLLSESDFDHNPEVQEKKAKLRQLKLVLEMWVISLYSSFIVCDLFRNVAKVVRLVGRGVRSHVLFGFKVTFNNFSFVS